MKNILVTEFNGESNVLIYTETRSVQFVIDRLTQKGCKFNEVFEVRDVELQYYCIDERLFFN